MKTNRYRLLYKGIKTSIKFLINSGNELSFVVSENYANCSLKRSMSKTASTVSLTYPYLGFTRLATFRTSFGLHDIKKFVARPLTANLFELYFGYLHHGSISTFPTKGTTLLLPQFLSALEIPVYESHCPSSITSVPK